jgi:hypothetical protein
VNVSFKGIFIFVSDEYDCNEELLKGAALSATSSLRDRGPQNARLYGMANKEIINVAVFILLS